jgi:hypothetical protein
MQQEIQVEIRQELYARNEKKIHGNSKKPARGVKTFMKGDAKIHWGKIDIHRSKYTCNKGKNLR